MEEAFGEYILDGLSFQLFLIAEEDILHGLDALFIHRKVMAGNRFAFDHKPVVVMQWMSIIELPDFIEDGASGLAKRWNFGTDVP